MPPNSLNTSRSAAAVPATTLPQPQGDALNPQPTQATAQQVLAAAQSATPSSSRTLVQLLGELLKLPLFPATAQQAMTLAHDENTSLEELSKLVETDVTLTASILKLANSPLFTWAHPMGSVNQAVVRLGLRECRHLIVAISMRDLFAKADPVTKGFCAILWNHCLLTACLCRRLRREFSLDFQGEEFTAGLLHDLGRIVFAVTLPSLFPAADPMEFLENAGTLVRETDVLGTDHCRLGSHYAEQNGLPASAVAAIRFHHQIEEASSHRQLVGLVAAADHMANYLQRCQQPAKYDLSVNPGFIFLSRAWSTEKIRAVARLMPKLLNQTVDAAARQANPRNSIAAGSRG